MGGMKTKERVVINVKSLPRARREALRAEAWAAFQNGESPSALARRLHIRVRLAFSWKKQVPSTPEEIPTAATEARRGPPPATGAALTAQQLRKLDRTVADKDPEQLKFPFALWSSKAVVSYVQRTFGVTICRRTARRYLWKLGYTYQCPTRRAFEQNLVDVATWKTVTYPGIRLMAHAAGGVVLWGDEAAVQTRTTKARGYGKRGQPPLLQVPSSYGLRTNYISAAGNRGDFHFMTFKNGMNVATLQEFFRRLMHDEPRPIYLILDNLRVHHATHIRDWLAEASVARHLKLFFLPPYSPELNPDELVHRTVKARVAEEVLPESIHAQQAQVLGILEGLKRSPETVARLFNHPLARYASRAM